LLVTSDAALFQAVSRTDVRTYSDLLKPVAVLTSQPVVMVANPDTGARTVADVIAKAKSASSPLPYATATATGTHRVVAEAFFRRAGIALENVPYKGGGQAVQDLVSGQVGIGMLGAAPVMAPIRSGKLTAVAVSSATSSTSLPDTPTIAEAGFPGFDMTQWFAVVAPPSMADPLAGQIAAAMLKALADPAVVRSLEKAGLEPNGEDPAAFAKRIAQDKPVWLDAAKTLGISTR
ncbi:MAG: tripartite tricarboxylate transporter substrate binding protein, partial [Hyphomicrobiales bacterium]